MNAAARIEPIPARPIAIKLARKSTDDPSRRPQDQPMIPSGSESDTRRCFHARNTDTVRSGSHSGRTVLALLDGRMRRVAAHAGGLSFGPHALRPLAEGR